MRQILYYSAELHYDVSDEMMMMKTFSCSSFSSPEKSDRAVVVVETTAWLLLDNVMIPYIYIFIHNVLKSLVFDLFIMYLSSFSGLIKVLLLTQKDLTMFPFRRKDLICHPLTTRSDAETNNQLSPANKQLLGGMDCLLLIACCCKLDGVDT